MAELQQGTCPEELGVTKWRWLVPEAERAAGCSCMVHRTRNPSAVLHPVPPPLVAFEPTHTVAELVSAREAHAAHFTSHIAPEILLCMASCTALAPASTAGAEMPVLAATPA